MERARRRTREYLTERCRHTPVGNSAELKLGRYWCETARRLLVPLYVSAAARFGKILRTRLEA